MEADSDDDDEFSMMARRFRKFFKKEQGKFSNKEKFNNDSKKPVICYECNKPGHYKTDCPQLENKEKKKFNNFKKKAYVSAIWGDSSDDEEEENANICLVAQEDEAEVNDFSSPYDELLCEFALMQTEFEKLNEKYKSLKKENTILKEQIQESSKEKACEKIFEKPCDNCTILKNKNLHLTKTLEKFTKGSETLNVILSNQRFINDKSGIGYKPEFDKRKGKKKFGERNYLNYFQKAVHSSNPFAKCNYCNRKGHSTSTCFHRKNKDKNKPLGNYQWVPKGTFKVPMTQPNPKGPKKKWVPKT